MPHQHFQGFGFLEWTVTALAAVLAIWSIWLSVRYTLHPGETEPDHIKRLILEDAGPTPGSPTREPASCAAPSGVARLEGP